MKRIVSIIIASIMFFSLCSINSSAFDEFIDEEIISEDISSARKSSLLNISNGTATCKSTFSDINSNIYSVKAVQTFEKHWALGMFFEVDGTNWERTVYSDTLSMTNYKNNLDSGTYRLKTVFTVTRNNGQTESITVYSVEVTI